MKQIIVYKDKPASINNKNDNAKTAYQNSLRSSKSARCFYHGWRFDRRYIMETKQSSRYR